jgi:hypothetical protein
MIKCTGITKTHTHLLEETLSINQFRVPFHVCHRLDVTHTVTAERGDNITSEPGSY